MSRATLPLPASPSTNPSTAASVGPVIAIEPLVVDLLTAGEVLGGISDSSVRRLISRGDLKAVKVLDRTFIAVSELRGFVARLTA